MRGGTEGERNLKYFLWWLDTQRPVAPEAAVAEKLPYFAAFAEGKQQKTMCQLLSHHRWCFSEHVAKQLRKERWHIWFDFCILFKQRAVNAPLALYWALPPFLLQLLRLLEYRLFNYISEWYSKGNYIVSGKNGCATTEELTERRRKCEVKATLTAFVIGGFVIEENVKIVRKASKLVSVRASGATHLDSSHERQTHSGSAVFL